MSTVKVLAIAGSLRKASTNRGLIRAALEMQVPGVTLSEFDIADIPLFNGDVEAAGLPEPVKAFRARLRESDAVLIATPEYNYSIPGVLKNAIDWASRSYPGDPQSFSGKALALMGASSGGFGTDKSQFHFRQVAVF